MEQEDGITGEAERREEEEAFARQIARARHVAENWPEWKRQSGLRWWPNGAAPAEAEESESEKDNGHVEVEPT